MMDLRLSPGVQAGQSEGGPAGDGGVAPVRAHRGGGLASVVTSK